MEHLKKGGLPANVDVLENIKTNLSSGTYRKDRLALAKELKSDPALFTHYLKRLYSTGNAELGLQDPLEALKVLEDEQLIKIFDVTPSEISVHSLSKSGKQQALRLQHTLISSHTAEVIAVKSDVAPGLAYSSAVLRQLALNLIAWNYPTIYSKALANIRARGGDLITELQRQLGVSPLQIASRLMADWNLGAGLRNTVVPDDNRANLQTENKKLDVNSICEIAELYAKSHDRANFPEAEAQWRKLEPVLKEEYGANLFEEVEHVILESVSKYQASAPSVFSAPLLAKALPEVTVTDEQRARLGLNQFALRLTPSAREAFSQAYHKMEPGSVSVESIRQIVEAVFPLSGFTRGCLYLSSKDGTSLKPTLRLGDMPLTSYQVMDHKEQHPIVDCLVATVPLKWNGKGIRGNDTEIVAGSLGALRHPGVLYLELSEALSKRDLAEILLAFHALRKAFLDFLADGGE